MVNLTLSKTWQILGPFPIGMREQDFGADPLEAYGGFYRLPYSEQARYPSELVDGGLVGWSSVEATDGQVGPIDFPHVRWHENTVPFGWSIEQYQAWARTVLVLDQPTTFLMQVKGVSEFYINTTRYSGDFYGYGTIRHVVRLGKGLHMVQVRMVHDVRVNGGGQYPPQCSFKVLLDKIDNGDIEGGMVCPKNHELEPDILVPSYLAGMGFAGQYGSVSLQNCGVCPLRIKSLTVQLTGNNQSLNGEECETVSGLIGSKSATIAPGQTCSVGFHFYLKSPTVNANSLKMVLLIQTVMETQTAKKTSMLVSTVDIKPIDWNMSAFCYTFLDYDGTVQYAMAKKPRVLDMDPTKPIVLALHGADVEANSEFWTESINTQENVWIIFPTGRTPWGYDWHGPSMKNAFKALESLSSIKDSIAPPSTADNADDWVLVNTSFQGSQAQKDRENWVVGNVDRHSNGGQGAWYLGSHYPDRAIAVIPAAGYIKIQDYVSYANWNGSSHADPLLKGLLECAIAEYNNDLHISNMSCLAVLPRVGSEDDNVPPLHTRKYCRLLNEEAKDPCAIRLSEVPEMGHWWSSVLNDDTIQSFLDQQIQNKDVGDWKDFVVSVINPAGTGSVRGIEVEQLEIPFRLGKIKATKLASHQISLKTANVSAFRVHSWLGAWTELVVDGQVFYYADTTNDSLFVRDYRGSPWKTVDRASWPPSGIRSKTTYGPIHRMYEASRPLIVRVPSAVGSLKASFEHAALQLSHDWYLYGRGNALIIGDQEEVPAMEGCDLSVQIYLGLPSQNRALRCLLDRVPNDIILTETSIGVGQRTFDEPGTGILSLIPGVHSRELGILVAGLDVAGFDAACRLLPRRTGMLVPEWIVTTPEARSKGIGGILGAGGPQQYDH
ncbi:hypothetical protein CLU79DRAFT_832973 [Phycomyces nitens]|nr:hypothetical protein CLU79DRAFT_832973 [Phycomyces nitens]